MKQPIVITAERKAELKRIVKRAIETGATSFTVNSPAEWTFCVRAIQHERSKGQYIPNKQILTRTQLRDDALEDFDYNPS